MNRIFFLMLFALLCSINWSIGQITPAEVSSQLSQRGIPEDSLRARLQAKGIDTDNITPENFVEFQNQLEETVLEFEAAQSARVEIFESPSQLTESILVNKGDKEMGKNQNPSDILEEIEKIKNETEIDENQIYGHSIFNAVGLSKNRSFDNVKPPDSYILASGDRVIINIFGPSSLSKAFLIDDEGFISSGESYSNFNDINFPRLYLKGLTFVKGREAARRHFAKYYVFSQGQFEMTLSNSRNVTVGIYGEVNNVGSIVIPANNTAINALSFAGGILPNGSVRKIKLISSLGEQIIDIYKFLNNPTELNNYFIYENDVIHVPSAKKVVAIYGAVIRPMKYELLENEDLRQLVVFSGGLTADAYTTDVEITRFDNNQKVVTNARLDQILDGVLDYKLRNGDIVKVKTINPNIQKAVFVTGAVVNPGKYESTITTRLTDILNQGKLKETARLDFAYILRFRPDSTYSYENVNLTNALNSPNTDADPLLNSMDQIVILDQAEFSNSYTFQVTGAVRAPNAYDFNPAGALKISDAITISGGLLPTASNIAFVIRRDIFEPKQTEYIPFNPIEIFSNPNSQDNIELEANDVIRIINKTNYKDEFFVRVSGSVRTPGIYEYDPNITLEELLQLSNGLKFSAATNKVDISRVVMKGNSAPEIINYTAEVDRDLSIIKGGSFGSIMPFDHIIVRDIPGFELQRNVFLKGEVNYPGNYSISSDNETLSSIVERAGNLTNEAFSSGAALFRKQENIGFVVIQLDKAIKNKNSTWDLIMKEGDTLYIPKQEDIVQIEGAINAKLLYRDEYLKKERSVAVGYEGNKNALYYVNEYGGGVNENGSKSKITVEQPNGKIEKTKSFLFFKSYPNVQKGARIIVGSKHVKENSTGERIKEPVEWDKVLRDTIAQATAVLTLIILINNANR